MKAELLIYIASMLAFFSVVALVEAVSMLWGDVRRGHAQKVSRRLEGVGGSPSITNAPLNILREKKYSARPGVDRFLSKVPKIDALDGFLEQAGLRLSAGPYLVAQFGIFVVVAVFFAGILKVNLIASLGLGILSGIGIPYYYVSYRRRKRQLRFSEQLPDALDYIARSLRAGGTITASMKSVSEELPDPLATEFRLTFEEINYGLELENALAGLAERGASEDIRYFVTAVLIQKQTGGNLADILNRISEVIRARARTQGEVRIQAAEMRLSARVLIALPFVFAFLVTLSDPGYISVLTANPVGRMVLGIQILLMLVGYLIIRRMVRFRI